MAIKKAKWTAEEKKRLEASAAMDVSTIKVAAALKRS